MASGDTLLIFLAVHNEPPASNYATFARRNAHSVLEFDPSTEESAVFSGILPRQYDGGGITVYVHSSTDATAGDAVFKASFERIGDGQQDIDSDSFAAAQSVTFTVPGTSGLVSIDSIAFTDGAQVDSIAVGELFRLKVARDATNGDDTVNSDDMQLLAVELKET